jgi:hypothetical protein
MRIVIFLLMATICATATAQSPGIVYDQVTVLTKGWENKGQPFCYTTEFAPEQKCLTLSTMGEIQLRKDGQWSQNPADQFYIGRLSEDARQTASQYYKLYVRYLAMDGNRFLVHIVFLQDQTKPGAYDFTQTIFASGNHQLASNGDVPSLESMSFSNGLEYLGAVLLAIHDTGIAPEASANKDEIPRLRMAIVTRNLALLEIGNQMAQAYMNAAGPGTAIPGPH